MSIVKKIKRACSRKAFTLAEVMITLGVIGIVAAITMPVLVHNANAKKFSAQFKKTLSTLSQLAVTTNSKFDFDYTSIKQPSVDSNCASDKLSNQKTSMCAMLNETLSGATYRGVYGTVKGASLVFPYQIKSADSSSFNPNNFLLYSLADGSMIGFDPAIKECHLPMGSVLSSQVLNTSLAKCIGFIDVNGVQGPNKEVTCIDSQASFGALPCPLKKGGSSEDVYPVVFHDGKAEPATNAARAVLMYGASKEGFYSGSSGDYQYQ